MLGQVQGRFLGLVAIGDQASHQVDYEVCQTGVTGMFDVRDVLQRVENRLQNGAATQ
jgi:hypothetical protein